MDEQGVHIGAQADGDWARAALERAHNAGLAEAAMDLESKFAKLRGDEIGRRMLLKRGFRVGVEVSAPLRRLVHNAPVYDQLMAHEMPLSSASYVIAPRAATGHKHSTRAPLKPTYQS